MAADVARYHHERYDGTGYCAGLAGLDIPLAARIVAVADVYDALTSKRVYKEAYSPEKSREIIRSEAGAHFDPVIVEAFESCFEQLRAPCEQCSAEPVARDSVAPLVLSS